MSDGARGLKATGMMQSLDKATENAAAPRDWAEFNGGPFVRN